MEGKMEFKHELAQNKEQYEGYTVFHINVKGSDKPIRMVCLEDVKKIVKMVNILEGNTTNLEKLRQLEHKLTLIRDDFSGYGDFIERNIRQGKKLESWEEYFRDLIETIESLEYRTDTEKEREGLRRKIVNIIKMAKPC